MSVIINKLMTVYTLILKEWFILSQIIFPLPILTLLSYYLCIGFKEASSCEVSYNNLYTYYSHTHIYISSQLHHLTFTLTHPCTSTTLYHNVPSANYTSLINV